MANLVTNQVQITILSTEDSTNNVLVNRSIQPSLDGFVANGVFYGKTPDALIHTLSLPPGFIAINHLYVRNTAPLAGGAILVSIQPLGSGAISPPVLGPGDVFLYWMAGIGAPAIGGVQQAISQVQITGSAAGITYEYFMGA